MKKVVSYFYHIMMAVLAICNSIFLIHSIKEDNLTININETSIILTIIGFFFTFTGMYVFSVFEANVEKEKREIRNLKNKYENELTNTIQGVSTVSKLIHFYQIGQLIVNVPRMNRHVPAWTHEFRVLYKEQTDYIRLLYNCGVPIYKKYKDNLLDVCRGLSQSFSIMIERIENNEKSFFEDKNFPKSEQKRLMNELKDLNRLLLKEIELKDDEEQSSNIEPKDNSLFQRIKRAWKELKGNTL